MAKGIILSSANSESFKPLTYQMPVGLLPVVNKPIMEHQVELFVHNDIKEIWLSCNHLSNRVQNVFGDGTRWGARIGYNFERPPFGSVAALRQLHTKMPNDTMVAMHSDIITGIDLKKALEFHWSKRADATFVCHRVPHTSNLLSVALDDYDRVHAVSTLSHPSEKSPWYDAGIVIFEPDVLDLIPASMGYNLLSAFWLAAQRARIGLFGYRSDTKVTTIATWQVYSQVQSDALAGEFPELLVPGLQMKKDLWVGKNASLPNDFSSEGPVVIGDNCRIGKGVTLGSGTVIGHDVMVDVGASLENSVVLPKTFVAARSTIRDSILHGDLRIEVGKDSLQPPGNSLVAFEIRPAKFSTRLYHFMNKAGAAALIVGLSPIVLGLLLVLIVAIKFPLYTHVKRLKVDLKELARGNLRLDVFDLLFFGPTHRDRLAVGYNPEPVTVLPHFISRIANLVNVMRGDILLVGNRPMDPEVAFSITEEWQRTRFKCQCGIISILDTNEVEGKSDDEKAIAEGYYAVHRDGWMDLKILINTGLRIFGRMSGKITVIRETVPRPDSFDGTATAN